MSVEIPKIKGHTIIRNHPAHKYAVDVVEGRINVCLRVHQACERYLRDINSLDAKGWIFDYKEASYVIDWFKNNLRHPAGKYAGKPFELLPWQQFIIWNLHGFINKSTKKRRFNYSYVQIPKKNGKTTLGAGHSLYMLVGDTEESPEIYYSATTRDQARIAFREAKNIANSSPNLLSYLRVMEHNITCDEKMGFARALSSDANTSEGINVFFALIDEYHVHDSAIMYNALKAGMIAREQPLHSTITTAGFNTISPCYELYTRMCDLLDGKTEDESVFTIIYELDKDDDWENPESWTKANPSMGHGVTLERMQVEYTNAKNEGGSQIINFKTKHLNIWCNAQSEWIPQDVIMAARVAEPIDTTGMKCWAGLDLASTSDITALAQLFELNDGRFYLKLKYWLPEETIKRHRLSNNSHPYIQWVDKGWINITPGNVTDYDSIRLHLTGHIMKDGVASNTGEGLSQRCSLIALAYDRWNSSQLMIDLNDDGVKTYLHGQGYQSMSSPTKELERLLLGKMIVTDADPVFAWMMGNVTLDRDPAGNQKPNKAKSKNKIDGVVAAIMSIGAHAGTKDEVTNQSPESFKVIHL